MSITCGDCRFCKRGNAPKGTGWCICVPDTSGLPMWADSAISNHGVDLVDLDMDALMCNTFASKTEGVDQ